MEVRSAEFCRASSRWPLRPRRPKLDRLDCRSIVDCRDRPPLALPLPPAPGSARAPLRRRRRLPAHAGSMLPALAGRLSARSPSGGRPPMVRVTWPAEAPRCSPGSESCWLRSPSSSSGACTRAAYGGAPAGVRMHGTFSIFGMHSEQEFTAPPVPAQTPRRGSAGCSSGRRSWRASGRSRRAGCRWCGARQSPQRGRLQRQRGMGRASAQHAQRLGQPWGGHPAVWGMRL